MKHKQKKKGKTKALKNTRILKNSKTIKKTKTSRRRLDKILMAAVGVIIITGLVLFGVGAVKDNMTMAIVGAAMLPGTGILITPNIVLNALKDSKDWKSRSFKDNQKKLQSEPFFYKVEVPSQYRSKLIFGVVREALWNIGKLLIVIVLIFCVNYYYLKNSGRDLVESFLIIIAVIVLGVPMASYNITCSVYRIRTVVRRDYTAYHAIAGGVDNVYMWIMGESNEKNESAIYKFDYCRCLGIRAKKIENTEVILVFVPDEIYLIPYKQS